MCQLLTLKKLLNLEENKNKVKNMKPVIIDSSTFLNYQLLRNPYHEASQQLFDMLVAKYVVYAPSIFEYEIYNALRTCVLAKQIIETDGVAIINLFKEYEFHIVNFNKISDESFRLSCQENISIYDASYVVLSILKNCDFWTCDRKLFDKIKSKHKNVKFVGNYRSEV